MIILFGICTVLLKDGTYRIRDDSSFITTYNRATSVHANCSEGCRPPPSNETCHEIQSCNNTPVCNICNETQSCNETGPCIETSACNETVTCNQTSACNETIACNQTASCNETVACNETASCNETVACNETSTCNETVACNQTSACNETVACNETATCNETLPCNETITCNDTLACNETLACNTTVICTETPTCNETTEECMHGCQEGFTGPLCNVTCMDHCVSCSLKPDSTFETECHKCESGSYRESNECKLCSHLCQSNTSSSLSICRESDGRCQFGCSKPTLTGPKCKFSCDQGCHSSECDQDGRCLRGCYAGFWKPTCDGICNVHCRESTSLEINQCNDTNGECVFGCVDNKWWGKQCSQGCSVHCKGGVCDQIGNCLNECETKEWFGDDCTKQCSENCVNGTCLQTNGTCIGGCALSWFGDTCDKECPEHCDENLCFVDDGKCAKGCDLGWFNERCDEECSVNCVNTTCFPENGTCTSGCQAGFIGINCTSAIPIVTPPEPADTMWIYIVSGGIAAIVLGIIIIAGCRLRAKQNVNRRRHIVSTIDGERPLRGRSDVFTMVFTENPLTSYFKKHKKETYFDEDEPPAKIRVANLLDHVLLMDFASYNEEFKKLKTDQLEFKAHEVSRQIDNLAKNFYDGIYPYDINRVVLQPTPSAITDQYINASFIKGYSSEKSYIAAQGPSKTTSQDFWRMVWEQDSSLIVMLTVIPEGGTISQCEKYWPDSKEMTYLEKIGICCVESECFSDFCIRKFKITYKDEDKLVDHLQFTYWPDNGPLPEAADMMEFHQKYRALVKSRDCTGPIIVHCTAGVGRTGVFIALDILCDEGQATGSVGVYECVSHLRDQRINMVQTCDQYEFLYKIVAQTLALQCQFVAKVSFAELLEDLQKKRSNGQSKMELVFKNCDACLRLDDVYIESISGFQERHMKDRPTSDVPEKRYRSMLMDHTYINAVSVDTYKMKDGMVVTQMPTPETVEDFYKLVIEKDCGTVVMLNTINTDDSTLGIYWPSKVSEVVKHGDIQVSLTNEEVNTDHVVRKLKFEDDQTKGFANQVVLELTMIQYTGWEQVTKIPDARKLIELINTVRCHVGNQPSRRMLVHCLNGSEQTGLFCVLYNMLEKLDCEDAVGIMTTVRKLKTRRPSAIPDIGQFEYCYQVVIHYIEDQMRGNGTLEQIAESSEEQIIDTTPTRLNEYENGTVEQITE